MVKIGLKSKAPSKLIEMVWIPAGTFTMGSPMTEAGREAHEIQRQVTLTQGFYMGKYQVTQDEYLTVMGRNLSRFMGNPAAGEIQGKRPAEDVDWFEAIEFCNKLSIREGLTPAYEVQTMSGEWTTDPATWRRVSSAAVRIVANSTGYRLPTEAQWEYACRAGTTTAYNTGARITNNTGWYSENSDSKTRQVGLLPANAWGLHDMHGNVVEWCWDLYGDYVRGAQTDPMGAVSGTNRVQRGGGWSSSATDLRSAYRRSNTPLGRGPFAGFRVVRP